MMRKKPANNWTSVSCSAGSVPRTRPRIKISNLPQDAVVCNGCSFTVIVRFLYQSLHQWHEVLLILAATVETHLPRNLSYPAS
jgi:hypothetical protein